MQLGKFPQDVLERIALFVGVPSEIARYGSVCRSFYTAAAAPHIWQELATIKFGKALLN